MFRSPLVVVVALALGCTNGVSTDLSLGAPGANQPRSAHGARGPDGPDPHGPDGTEGEGEEPVAVVPSVPQIRLLSGAEYKETVRDLLGLELSSPLTHADWSSGYDTGSGNRIEDNLLSQLLTNADDLARRWVNERAATEFACFHATALTDTCVKEILDTLGARAQRRPLEPALKDELLATYRALVAEDDPVPFGACDPTTQAAPHWGDRDGQCRPSCGVLAGACTASCGEGAAPSLAYDCDVCCVSNAQPDVARTSALEHIVARLLVSPRFLYRTEVGSLDAFERASLVSYALTGSMPDQALFDDARADTLDPETLAAHVDRLLHSPRGQARLAQMIEQWARAADLEMMAERPEDYSKLESPEQGRALRDEVAAFVRATLFEGTGTLRELLTSNTMQVNRFNAPLYGLASDSDAFLPVTVDALERSGLFTLPGVMAVHAWKDAESIENDRPVKRGLLVLNKLLCGELHLPANFMPALLNPDTIEDFDFITTREQFTAAMNQNESCRSCHVQFMPYGFAFASYDGLGRYRTHQRGLPLNTAVDAEVREQAEHFTGAPDMLAWIAEQPETAECFARNYVAYVLGSTSGTRLPPYDPASGLPPPDPDRRPVDTLARAAVQSLGSDRDNVAALIGALLTQPETFERSAP